MSKEKLIPDLRFPEFKNEGEWTETILGSVVEMKGRIGYRGYTTEDIVDKGKGAITLSPSNFKENGQLNFDKCTYISWAKYDESPEIQLEEGQTVLVKTASVGKTAYVDKLPEKATVNPQIVVLKPKTIHNRFLTFTVSHQNSQTQIRNNVGAGAIPNISQEIISKIKILIPPDRERKEQQKIALCLSSLDEVISAQSQKLYLLKEHKKGLMQNLFPQEGEKVPKYRFKEFEKNGEWVEKKLGTLGEPLMCKRILKEQTTTNPKNGVPFYKIGTFGKEADAYIPIGLYEEFKSKYSFPKKGDILISASGTIGRLVIYDGLPAFFQDSNIVWLGNDESLVQNIFLYHCYTKIKWQTSDGGIISRLYNSDLRNMEIHFPKNKIEQQKIAECLSSLDALINAQDDKIEQLKWHKKGLMQGLFPKIQD